MSCGKFSGSTQLLQVHKFIATRCIVHCNVMCMGQLGSLSDQVIFTKKAHTNYINPILIQFTESSSVKCITTRAATIIGFCCNDLLHLMYCDILQIHQHTVSRRTGQNEEYMKEVITVTTDSYISYKFAFNRLTSDFLIPSKEVNIL